MWRKTGGRAVRMRSRDMRNTIVHAGDCRPCAILEATEAE